ncbi:MULTISPECIES: hypothetical protein [unclassified Mycoplasma]|uniref:hypothetical protein n=1 Tax=unclassified Mycoplasma TaxID=2683645 RepID=UPI00211C1CE0|nr:MULTISPECIES: hypothetical protein [unclassified Mycoplasma]UUM19975.1 hypothetical protein NPA11_00870 [Mycoplasma sp. 1578d]UUM24956.1 hypothetical protein NPA12_00855 [Mycoplasma sp. 3686d]
MFGIYDTSFKTLKTIKELWNKENEFKRFVISNGIAIFVLFLLNVTINILLLVFKADIVNKFLEIQSANPQNSNININVAAMAEWNNLFISTIWPSLFFFIANVLFVRSVYQSYKEQNFMRLFTSNIVICISMWWSFGWTIKFSYLGGIATQYPFVAVLALFITNFLFSIIVIIAVSRHLYLIKRAFAFAFHLEQRKKMFEQFSKFSQQNPFGFNFPFNQTNEQEADYNQPDQEYNNAQTKAQKSATELEKEREIKKLLDLKTEQLHKLAQLLGIYGYIELSKEELAEKIYNYTRKNNTNK